jgi:hypothetical protein
MKTSEFKKILKPLIEQTVKEVLLKEGVLSKVVAEVARGLNQPLLESRATSVEVSKPDISNDDRAAEYEKQRQEKIKRLNESTGYGSKIFDNVRNVPENSGNSPLAGVDSRDAGVDISGIQKLASGKWKQLAGDN